MIKSFKELSVWKKGMCLVKLIYQKTSFFPDAEKYGLAAQMRRSSVSIVSNIAEGFRRKHQAEFRRFLYVSLGSLAELETQILLSEDLCYLNESSKTTLLEHIDHISRMAVNLIKKIG